MFELSIARRYLFPRWRQISVSIISTLSILVIALVVWLIVVFFSVKDGLESGWINTIVALTAPVRVTPTEHYYKSYYYLSDSISNSSNYTTKSISEKRFAASSDPYNSEEDEEIPSTWPEPDRLSSGEFIDPVKQAFAIANNLQGLSHLSVNDYETAVANVVIEMHHSQAVSSKDSRHSLEQVAYLGSLDEHTPAMTTALLQPQAHDVDNLLNQLLATKPTNEQIAEFFDVFNITALETPAVGWKLPPLLLPAQVVWQGVFLPNFRGGHRAIVPINNQNIQEIVKKYRSIGILAEPIEITIENGTLSLTMPKETIKSTINDLPLYLESNVAIPAEITKEHIKEVKHLSDIPVIVHITVQGTNISGEINLSMLNILTVVPNQTKQWKKIVNPSIQGNGLVWPTEASLSAPILLPKGFKDAGALIGDTGHVSYFSPTPSAIQEQRLSVYVAGFYDPGIMPIGSKYVIAPKALVSEIHGSIPNEQAALSNGINIRFDDIKNVGFVKQQLKNAFEEAGIAPYWKIETYQEFEFTKDLIQQLSSEKNLFSLISLIIIIVACSNIISMLIILVNDKKVEIGILRSMGATWAHIATIFGFCGMVIGAMGSLIGIGGAILTLHYINELVNFLGRLQGYDLFNPVFYGKILPSQLNFEALSLVFAATALISLLAGMIPAIKASLLRPSAILRAE